jgi:metalloprotein, YbeY/UPF0054 family
MPERLLQVVHFHFVDRYGSLKDRKLLKKFLIDLTKKEGHKLRSIHYIFCSDSYLLKLNQDYLKHNTLTDIITFPLSKKSELIEAEIYISLDRVKENAGLYKTTLKEELHRVIFHGLLHLCGYKDKSASEKTLMRKKEDEYLKKWFHVKHSAVKGQKRKVKRS